MKLWIMAAGPARLLVVEDEEAVREPVVRALQDAGYCAVGLADGSSFDEQLVAFRPDLVVLDLMLPGPRDGLALARAAHVRGGVGVVMVTARDGVEDRLRGFDVGADDYVVKPFATEELLARIRAVLRRLGRLPATVEVGDLLVDEAAGVAVRAGREVALTATEFHLLCYLVANRGRTLSKTRILTQVWGYEAYDPNVVEVHVSALRRKLEAHGPRLLHTVRGLGYRLQP